QKRIENNVLLEQLKRLKLRRPARRGAGPASQDEWRVARRAAQLPARLVGADLQAFLTTGACDNTGHKEILTSPSLSPSQRAASPHPPGPSEPRSARSRPASMPLSSASIQVRRRRS